MTKKEPEVGQLINIESPSPAEKPEKVEKKDDTSRVEDVRRKLRYVLSASDPVDSSPMQPSTRSTPSSQKEKLLELMRAQLFVQKLFSWEFLSGSFHGTDSPDLIIVIQSWLSMPLVQFFIVLNKVQKSDSDKFIFDQISIFNEKSVVWSTGYSGSNHCCSASRNRPIDNAPYWTSDE